MRKIRVLLLSCAIVTAVGGALAGTTSKEQACAYYPQYYKYLDTYIDAGAFGDDYFCLNLLGGVCTYYKPYPWSEWTPCRSGLYLPIIW